MIDPDVIKARYPDPPPKPEAWTGWQREKKSDGPFREVPGSTRPTKGACLQATVEIAELVRHDDGTGLSPAWDLLIMPAGQRPPEVDFGRLKRTR